MGNRIIKESIRTSKTVNSLTDFQFRVWVNLITYVDDYGRGSADPELLKSFLFPRRKTVTEKWIAQALTDLASIGFLRLYKVDGEEYLCLPSWEKHQRVQQKRSKFPAPPEESKQTPADTTENADAQQSTAGHREPPLVTAGHRESPPESNPYPNSYPNSYPKPNPLKGGGVFATPEALRERFGDCLGDAVASWLTYKQERKDKYTPTGLSTLLGKIERNAGKYGVQPVIDAIELAISNNWQGIVWEKIAGGKAKNGNHESGGNFAALDNWV